CTVVRDISERRRVQKEIQRVNSELEAKVKERTAEVEQQRLFLRQVIDLNPSFIFAKDRDGKFTLVNQALAEAYGAPVEDVIGKTAADFNSNPEARDRFQHDDLEVIEQRTERFIPEERITDVSGAVRWLQTIKRPIVSADGNVTQMLGVATDITARKKAEDALHESEEML